MKHCTDCRHYVKPLCTHPKAFTQNRSDYLEWLVSGRGETPPNGTGFFDACAMRMTNSHCGPDAELFEPKGVA